MFKTRNAHTSALWAILLGSIDAVSGAPTTLQARQADNSNTSNANFGKIWIPIAVVSIVLLLAVLACILKRRFIARRSSPARTPVARDTNTPSGDIREITAEQLAGGAGGGTGTTAPRTRRPRRPRRTPSQMSTVSLPAYNKEPGEEELVIYRGPEDMEDGSIPVMIPPAEEDEHSMHSRGNSNSSSVYNRVPHARHDQPLLDREEGGSSVVDLTMDDPVDVSTSYLMPPSLDHHSSARRSMDTLNSSDEQHSSLSGGPDPRGDAPAYFEAVDTADVAAIAAAAPAPSPEPERRRSGFRLFSNMIHSSSPPTTNAESGAARGHRPSYSGGSSNMFRTLSRQRSSTTMASSFHRHSPSNGNQLTSPSMISLNSISAPLTHTLTRTEFTYPKSGPTPDQLKLISSRESFGRFGMPYGADAIAFHASNSRQDLPPPDFDDTTHLGGTGPSRLTDSPTSLNERSLVDVEEAPVVLDVPQRTASPERIPPSAEISPPPTSFPSSTVRSRGATSQMSRASSMRSFATAQESLFEDANDVFETRPNTPVNERRLSLPLDGEVFIPRNTTHHVVEATDTTVTPANSHT